MTGLDSYLATAKSLALSAGRIHMKYFRGRSLGMETKINDYDVVTEADKKSEEMIISFLKEKYPDHGIISEERPPLDEDSEWRWVVDPLDGTTNFSQGLPFFSVSIALEHFGESVVGVVYAPYLRELFHAVKGKGAFLNDEPVKCSDKINFSEVVVATGIPYDKLDNPDNNLSEIVSVAPFVRGLRRLGSAALDLSYVAAGFLDAYWELNLKRWDVAAGRLIASEAGAKVIPIREDRNFSLMAACPGIYGHLLSYLTKK